MKMQENIRPEKGLVDKQIYLSDHQTWTMQNTGRNKLRSEW